MPILLYGLSTALPPHCLTQSDVRDSILIIFVGKYPRFEGLSKSFVTAGIDLGYSVVPIDWFSQKHGWVERNCAFMEGAKVLFIEAANVALIDACWSD